MENKRIIQVDEKVPVKLLIPLSIQHMFAMFGASVLVPFVLGINPAIVLFMNGLGTLLFILITKGRAPAYLGSSFAFLAPAGIVISKWGYDYALGCFVAVGFCGCVLALIIYKFGSEWINVVLPPAAMGPVVALIGLELAGTAASNAGLKDEVLLPDVYKRQEELLGDGPQTTMDDVDNINDALRLTFAKDYTVKVVYKGQEMGTFKWSLVYGLCNVESENPSVYVATNEDGSLNVDYSDDEDFLTFKCVKDDAK